MLPMHRGLLGIAIVSTLYVAAHAAAAADTAPATRPVANPASHVSATPTVGERWPSSSPHDLDRDMTTANPRATRNALSPTIYWENDGGFTKPIDISDRHYTAGVGLSLQWQNALTDDLMGIMPSIGDEFAPDKPKVSYAGGVIASMRMYSPSDLENPNPISDDWPYAGWSYIGVIGQRADRAAATPTMEHFELDFGTMGRQSQAGYVQWAIHTLFDQTRPEGWDHQVKNEVGGDAKYEHSWRMNLTRADDGTPRLQMIPYIDGTAGTIHINAGGGAVIRYGVNLPDDFGPSRMAWPGDFTSPSAGNTGGPGFYLFVRPELRAVGHDSTLGNSFFRDNTVKQDPNPLVLEVQAGIALRLSNHIKLVWSQTVMSPQVEDQVTWDSYATIVLSSEWTW